MRGLYVRGGRVELRDDLSAPAPLSGETRVRVLRAGVCATDLALARGYMGFEGVPGHEFVGVAIEGQLTGQRVVGEINAGCGACARCASGDPRHCPRRTVLGILGRPGAFAEEIALPNANLHALPRSISEEAAVFVEPLAAAFEILAQVAPAPETRALVIGDGRLGILCAHALASAGLAPVVAGRHPERAELLPRSASHQVGLVERGAPLPAGEFELVVEASGDPSVLALAIPCVQPGGTLVLKTTSERPAELDLAPVVVNELRVVGSRCGRFEPAIRALAAGAVPIEGLIAARFPLERACEAFSLAARGGMLKVLVDCAS